MADAKTNIQIRNTTKDFLDEIGRKKDSYDDVVARLIICYQLAEAEAMSGNPTFVMLMDLLKATSHTDLMNIEGFMTDMKEFR